MSYAQAFRIAWSLLWRQVAWVCAILISAGLLHEFLTHGFDLQWRYLNETLAGASLAVYVGLALPAVLRQLTEIDYPDFRVVLRRTREGPEGLTWGEAVVLALVVEILTDLSAWLAVVLSLLFVHAANTIARIPSGFASLVALLLAMPLKAGILFWIRTPGFRLEVLDDYDA